MRHIDLTTMGRVEGFAHWLVGNATGLLVCVVLAGVVAWWCADSGDDG